jgi:hypothetical protein
MYTTILAYVIAFLGFVMIGTGVWGLFYLQSGTRPILLRYCGMMIAMICGGFGLGGYCTRSTRVGRDCARNTAVLKFVIAHDKAGVQFLNGPWRREAAFNIFGRLSRFRMVCPTKSRSNC